MARIEADWQKLDNVLNEVYKTLQKTDQSLEEVKKQLSDIKVNVSSFNKLKDALSVEREAKLFNKTFNTLVKGLKDLSKVDLDSTTKSIGQFAASLEILSKVNYQDFDKGLPILLHSIEDVSRALKNANIDRSGKQFATAFNQVANSFARLENTDLESLVKRKFIGPFESLRNGLRSVLSGGDLNFFVTDLFKSITQTASDFNRVQLPSNEKLKEIGQFARALEQITKSFQRMQKEERSLSATQKFFKKLREIFGSLISIITAIPKAIGGGSLDALGLGGNNGLIAGLIDLVNNFNKIGKVSLGNVAKITALLSAVKNISLSLTRAVVKRGIVNEFLATTQGLGDVFSSLGKLARSSNSISISGLVKTGLALAAYASLIKRITKDISTDQSQVIRRFGLGAESLGKAIKQVSDATSNFSLNPTKILSTIVNLGIISNSITGLFKKIAKVGKKFDRESLQTFTEFVKALSVIIASLTKLSTQGVGGAGVKAATSIKSQIDPLIDVMKKLTNKNFKRVGKQQLLAIAEVIKGLGSILQALSTGLKPGSTDSFKEIVDTLSNTLVSFNKVKIDKRTANTLDSFVKIYEKLVKVGNQDINSGGFKDFAEAIRSFSSVDKLDEKSFKTLSKFADGLVSAVDKLRKVKFDKNQAEGLRAFADALQAVSRDLSGSSEFSFAPNIDQDAAKENGYRGGLSLANEIKRGFISANIEIFLAQTLAKAVLLPFKALGNLTFSGIHLLFNTVRSSIGYVSNLVQGFNNVRNAVREAGQTIREMGSDLRDAGQTLLETFDIRKLLNSSAFTAAADFDQRLTQIQVFGNATNEELQKYKDLAFQIGRDYPLSALDGLNAAFNLVKAGLSQQDITSALPSIADLTSLSDSQNIDEISKIIIATTNTFDRFSEGVAGNFENVAEAANIFSAASSLTNTTVESLGQGLVVVGATANSLGQDLDQTTAALAILQDSGLEAAQSGTALRGVLNDLSRDQAVNTLNQLGISLFNPDESRRSLNDVVSDLSVSLEGLTAAQKEVILNDLVGAEARGALNILLAQGEDGIADFVAAMEEVPPAQQRAADTLDNFKGDVIQLQGSLETLYIKGFIPLLEKAFRPFVQLARKVVDGMLNLDDSTLEFLTTGIALVSVIGTLAGVLTIAAGTLISIGGGLISIIPLLLSAQTVFLGIGGAIAGLTAGILVVTPLLAAFGALFIGLASIEKIFRENIGGAADAFRSLGATLGDLLSPLGAFTHLFVAMFRAVGKASDTSILESIGQGFASFARRIQTAITPLANVTKALSTFINDGLNNAFDAESVSTLFSGGFFSKLFPEQDLKSTQEKILFLESLFEDFFYNKLAPAKLGLAVIKNSFGQFFKDLGEGLSFSDSFETFSTKINAAMGTIVSSLLDGFSLISGLDTSSLQEAFRGNFVEGLRILLTTAREAALTFLVTNRDQIGEILRTIFRTFFVPGRSLGAIASLLGLNDIANIFNQISDFFSDLFLGIYNTVLNVIEGQSIGEAIRNGFGDVFGGALDPVFNLVGSLATSANLIISTISEIIRKIFFPSQDELNIDVAGGGLTGIISGLANGLNSAITFLNTNVLTPLLNLVTGINLSGLRNFISSLFGILGDIVVSIGQGDFGGAIRGLGEIFQLLITTISDFFSSLGITPASVLNAVATFVQGVLSSVVDALGNLGTDILNAIDNATDFDISAVTSILSTSFTKLSDAIKAGDPTAIAGGLVDAVLSLIGGAFSGLTAGLGTALDFDAQPIINEIASTLENSINLVDSGDIFGGAANGLTGFFLTAVETAFASLGAIFNIDVSQILDNISNIIDKNFALIKGGPGGIFAAIINSLQTALVATIEFAFAGLGELLNIDTSSALTIIQDDFVGAIESINNLFTGEDSALNNVVTIIENIVTAITSFFSGLAGGGGDIAKSQQGINILETAIDVLATIVTFPFRVIDSLAQSLTRLTGGLARISETDSGNLVIVLGALGAFLFATGGIGVLAFVPSLIAMFSAIYGFAAPLVALFGVITFISSLVDELSRLESFDVGSIVGAILQAFADLGIEIIEVLGLDTVFEDAFGENFDDFKERVRTNFEQLADIITLVFNSLGSKIGQVFDGILLDFQKTLLDIEANAGSGIIGDILNIPDRGISELKKIFNSEDPFDLSQLIAFVGENDIDPTAVNTYVRDSLGDVVGAYRQALASGDYQLSAADFVLLSQGNVFGNVLGELLNQNDFNFAQEIISNLVQFNPDDIQFNEGDFNRVTTAIQDAFRNGLIEGEQARLLLTDLLQFEDFDTGKVQAIIDSTFSPDEIAAQTAQVLAGIRSTSLQNLSEILGTQDSYTQSVLTQLIGTPEEFSAEAAGILDGTEIPLNALTFVPGETTRQDLYTQAQDLLRRSLNGEEITAPTEPVSLTTDVDVAINNSEEVAQNVKQDVQDSIQNAQDQTPIQVEAPVEFDSVQDAESTNEFIESLIRLRQQIIPTQISLGLLVLSSSLVGNKLEDLSQLVVTFQTTLGSSLDLSKEDFAAFALAVAADVTNTTTSIEEGLLGINNEFTSFGISLTENEEIWGTTFTNLDLLTSDFTKRSVLNFVDLQKSLILTNTELENISVSLLEKLIPNFLVLNVSITGFIFLLRTQFVSALEILGEKFQVLNSTYIEDFLKLIQTSSQAVPKLVQGVNQLGDAFDKNLNSVRNLRSEISGLLSSIQSINAAIGSIDGTVGVNGAPVQANLGVAGARASGGPVLPELLYQVNDTDQPELLVTKNGTYLLSPDAGTIQTVAQSQTNSGIGSLARLFVNSGKFDNEQAALEALTANSKLGDFRDFINEAGGSGVTITQGDIVLSIDSSKIGENEVDYLVNRIREIQQVENDRVITVLRRTGRN